jgi:predicted aspartyl protease
VDTGSFLTWVPSQILRELGLRPTGRQPLQMANGSILERDVTRAWISIDGRHEVSLVVYGDDSNLVLLGAYTLEGLFLTVDPMNHKLVPLTPLPAARG